MEAKRKVIVLYDSNRMLEERSRKRRVLICTLGIIVLLSLTAVLFLG